MKLISLIIGAAFAETIDIFDGSANEDGSYNHCGETHDLNETSFVNHTCQFTGNLANIAYKFAGNGAFITGPNSFTGYENPSSTINYQIFYTMLQGEDENDLDNSTCWNVALNCEPTGYVPGVYFMETANDHRGVKNQINLQISGVAAGDTLTIELYDFDGEAYNFKNVTADFGTITHTDNTNTQHVQEIIQVE